MKLYNLLGIFFVISIQNIFLVSEDKISFDKDIFPILKGRCFKCHSEKKQKGDLTFESREKTLIGGESGEVVVVGKSSESLLIKLVSSTDDSEYMPPKGDRLSKDEIKKLKDWIDQGLVWSEAAAETPEQKKK